MLEETTVLQAKRIGVYTCSPDLPVRNAADRMVAEDVSCLVAVDAQGALAGIVCRMDLLRAHQEEHQNWQNLLVKDIMSTRVFTVEQDTTLSAAAGIMLENNIHRVVIVRNNNGITKPVGVLSEGDLMYHIVKELSD